MRAPVEAVSQQPAADGGNDGGEHFLTALLQSKDQAAVDIQRHSIYLNPNRMSNLIEHRATERRAALGGKEQRPPADTDLLAQMDQLTTDDTTTEIDRVR